MLGMKTYRKDYFDACRARVEAGLRAYRKHIGKTASQDLEHRFFKSSQPASIASASPRGVGINRNQRIDPMQSRNPPTSQWFLARAFIARTNAETSRRRAMASAV